MRLQSVIAALLGLASTACAYINVTYPNAEAGWFLGYSNNFFWTNASLDTDTLQLYNISTPLTFNATLLSPNISTYQATYGPFVGPSGSAQLKLINDSISGSSFILQMSHFVASKDTEVVLGSSEVFSLGLGSGGYGSTPLTPLTESFPSGASSNSATGRRAPLVDALFALASLSTILAFVAI